MRVAIFRQDPVTLSGPKRFLGLGTIEGSGYGTVPVRMDASGEVTITFWDDLVVLSSGIPNVDINAMDIDGVFVAEIYIDTQSIGTVTFERGMFIARTLDMMSCESAVFAACINFLVANQGLVSA